ncbi:guanine deaminase [Allopusillimonas soli]|uniref:Guanine deaminase n=2 Tax=Allopusillimonas soli TaxID=659016 RepID=A0A853FCQ8_9BURK|nr:guanine deaminase [Allopusillimonas soli]TEA74073.1 guanine deaminase [Allopusillimonas soli]
MDNAAGGQARLTAYRSGLLYFIGAPSEGEHAAVHCEDGLLVIEDGRIVAAGDYARVAPGLEADVPIVDWRGKLIVPGFIDTHVHYPQTDMIASPAAGLLPWLETWTFPTEARFNDPGHAAEVARYFLDELQRCGTTTALVYCTVHPVSADAFFTVSHARNMRMVAGKVLMDRNCPEALRDTAESGARDSEALIQRWHGTGRQMYALTPRFAPTSTAAQLGVCGELAQRYPDVFIQSHVAENSEEVKWAGELFPGHRSYLDIYDRFGLLRPRAVYGHCIWLDDDDRRRMRDAGALAAHCPTSNLFLGSGLFDVARARQCGMHLALATDVGGGSSFSMLQTMNEAHKIARLCGYNLDAQSMFYLATQGAAQSLGLAGQIGTLAPGAEADFIVLDPQATPLLARRTSQAGSLEELLFAFAMLGDDRAVAATYVAGRRLHVRSNEIMQAQTERVVAWV